MVLHPYFPEKPFWPSSFGNMPKKCITVSEKMQSKATDWMFYSIKELFKKKKDSISAHQM